MKRHARTMSWHTAISLVVLLGSLALTACSQSQSPSSGAQTLPGAPQPSSGAIDQSMPTTGCGQTSPIRPGTSADITIPANPAVSEGQRFRMYRLHVPIIYDQNHLQAVILAFHGHGGNAAGMERGSGLSLLSDRQGFLVIYPQGLPDGEGGVPFWASVGPIDYGVDDALFVSNLLDDLQRKFCVDPYRFYATGFSNGGGLVGFLACRLAGRIAAFAPVSGNFYALPGGCHPGRPVPILDFHGTADHVLPYLGIPASADPAWPLPPIPQWLKEWAARDGCTAGPTTFLREATVTGEQWHNCQGDAALIHYRIEGGGHAWPPTIQGQSPAVVMWLFFQAHRLPGGYS